MNKKQEFGNYVNPLNPRDWENNTLNIHNKIEVPRERLEKRIESLKFQNSQLRNIIKKLEIEKKEALKDTTLIKILKSIKWRLAILMNLPRNLIDKLVSWRRSIQN